MVFVGIACGPTIPEASFTAAPVEGAAPLSVQFTDTSENTPTSWEWDFGDGATSTEHSPVYDYQVANTYDVTLVATNEAGSGTATTTRAITIGPGELARIEVAEQSVELQVGETLTFSVKAWDGFDNEISDAELSWEATGGGSVDSSGAFTAGTAAGRFEEALSVTVTRGSLTKTTLASVTIEPGPLDHVDLEPSAPTVEVATAQEFTATAFDQFDNPIRGLTYSFQATEETGAVDSQGSLVAGTRVGVYEDGVTVEAAQGAVTKSAAANVTLTHGPVHSLTLSPASASLTIGGTQQFTAEARDAFENPIPEAEISWQAADGAGTLDDQGLLTTGTLASTFKEGVKATATLGEGSASASGSVIVKPDPLHVVTLSPVEITAGETEQLTAVATDQYGNPAVDVQLTWTMRDENAGAVTTAGLLTAGEVARTFAGAGEPMTYNLDEFWVDDRKFGIRMGETAYWAYEAQQRWTTIPGLIEIVMGPIHVGDTISFATCYQFGILSTRAHHMTVEKLGIDHNLDDGRWGSDPPGGAVGDPDDPTNNCEFTFDAPGDYLIEDSTDPGAKGVAKFVVEAAGLQPIKVTATQGELTRSVTTSATVLPGPLDQVVIAPGPAQIGMEMTQQFVAVGGDQFGNRIAELTFTWSVESGGGTIGADGLFTAGTKVGTYDDTVKATATQADVSRSGVADVTVEPDRILFVSDRNDDQFDLYVMNADGTNVERLTSAAGGNLPIPSWSPDGRRVVSGSCPPVSACKIIASADDGGWPIIIPDEWGFHPSWSPDGSKIAFVSVRDGEWEVYVMDLDGGNQRRLTFTPGPVVFPSWSPDGTRIAFVSFRDGNGEIYLINADGSGETRLTSHPASERFPAWSPDGKEIAFESDRDGDVEVYVMASNGTGVRKLTSDPGYDGAPSWSADGTRILFDSTRDAENEEIYIMNADGTNVRRLTSNAAIDGVARWAPRKRGVEVTKASVVIPSTSTLKTKAVQQVTDDARGAVVRIETDLGSGSGFIVDQSGLILTTNHVTSGASEITVYLDDGTDYPGAVLGRDLVHDLAVVRIEAHGLTTLELGDLGEVKLGEQWLVVLGYPSGSESVSVASGLVSTTDYDSGRNITWVLTDAAVSTGHSGGPLLDLQGKVIGVVSGTLDGVSFAISANTVRVYLDTLKAGGVIGVTFDDRYPDWSPDGSKIVFTSNRYGDWEIFVMNTDGTELTRLTFNPAADTEPAWSPDGSMITFASNRDDSLDIYVMDADGKNVERLIESTTITNAPTWSPAGSKIAFQFLSSLQDLTWEIYVVGFDGSGLFRATSNESTDQEPTWSPDGAKIAFWSDRDGGRREIYVMSADGTDQVRLTDNNQSEFAPAWSPDGSRIAFHSRRDGNWDIYVMGADGSNEIRLTSNTYSDRAAAWSPDGALITFESAREGHFEIYVMNADGSDQMRMT